MKLPVLIFIVKLFAHMNMFQKHKTLELEVAFVKYMMRGEVLYVTNRIALHVY